MSDDEPPWGCTHLSHHESTEVDVVDELAERAPGTPHVQVLARLSKKPNVSGINF